MAHAVLFSRVVWTSDFRVKAAPDGRNPVVSLGGTRLNQRSLRISRFGLASNFGSRASDLPLHLVPSELDAALLPFPPGEIGLSSHALDAYCAM